MSRDDFPRTPTIRPLGATAVAINEDDSTSEAISSRSSSSGSGVRRIGENTAPLIQFLHKNLGRPWKDVYAGLCALGAPGSAAQKQLLDTVNELVATSVVMRDGKPHRLVEGGTAKSRFQPLSGSKWDSLYVCPKTGVLAAATRSPEPLRRSDPDVRPTGPLSQYRRINGIWYLVELAYIPSLVSALNDHYDVLLHAPLADISCEELRKMYGAYDRYAVSKRPLGKMELLRLTEELEHHR